MEIGLQSTIEKVTNNSQNTKTNHEYNKLSVQVSLNGLSFCIVDTIKNTVVSFDHLVFEKERTPYGLEKGLVALFKKHNLSHQTFCEIVVIHRNRFFSLVPKPLFNEDELANYLKFNTKILANDHLAYDELDNSDIVNVYVPFANVNNYIFELFGAFTFMHSGSVMINSLHGQRHDKNQMCYVYVADSQLEITIISQKKLIFYNSFTFSSKEDFIYYVLFTFEQLQLDNESIKLKLFGAIKEDDIYYKTCHKYIKNVSIHKPPLSAYPIDHQNAPIDFTVLNTL